MLESNKFYDSKVAISFNSCLLSNGINLLHVLAEKGMRANWRRAFADGIQGYYPDVQGKTPLDYIV